MSVASAALEKFWELENFFESSGILTQKVRYLIGIATANRFRNGKVLASFLELARNSSIPESEIDEAILISGLETSGTQLFWLKDVFDKVLPENNNEPYHISGGNEIGNLWVKFQQSVYEESSLSGKDKELITVTQASFGRCPHCTKTHIAAARKHGCSAREITEAILFSATVAAKCDLQWFKETEKGQ
ncbi:carboxymuconolactone decarboxylase family protein [Thermoplasmatales archaeon AK]|nr:carboxymuconolactone decarboxylase family protein [Thermoplasmatales archaeon AK]